MMKKLLGILVLGLLLSGNAYAENIYLICNRTIYENNGSGDWSLFYKEGQSDQPILISINEKNSSVKMIVHLAENDSGEPEKIFEVII